MAIVLWLVGFFRVFIQAEDGIRDLVRSRGLGDVYKRQGICRAMRVHEDFICHAPTRSGRRFQAQCAAWLRACLLYTSDAADERSSVDLGGRRIIKKKTHQK